MAADPKSPTPESPTTARPLEMDDDDVQEASISQEDGVTSKTATSTANSTTSGDAAAAAAAPATGGAAATSTATTVEDAPEENAAAGAGEAAPPKPPRPMTEQQKNEQTLKEAFPDVDIAVVRAVLTASRGNIEAAFHALLEMTDPSAVEQEPAPPPPPPRPAVSSGGRLSPNSQMLADEEYARQLAQRYENEDGNYEARTSRGYGAGGGRTHHYQQPRETGLKPNEMWGDKEHSFLDDDLPVIRENLRKGFAETQTKFNTWFTGIKKKIDEEWIGNDDNEDHRPQNGGQGQGRQGYGRGGFGGRQPPRRSGDYDADPELLSDDFGGIQLHGDGTPVRQNPNVFRPPPSTSPRPSSERKVAFRDQDETIDMYNASPKLPPKDGAAGNSASPAAGGAKASKWQPMSSVDPTPMADNDPFSLGDSEDEKDNATSTAAKSSSASKTDATESAGAKTSTSSTSPEDAERLRKAAAEAMADSLVDDNKK
ncbi:ubiquitin-binding protein cue5 [Sporothrix eucalyptigena]|uniref:Ubiquitin-binding protein cue5 n=1 Tax=Sporothrix eucalyptigena TaxID=1812306 RepID=A0ABP0CCI0_9PEZI